VCVVCTCTPYVVLQSTYALTLFAKMVIKPRTTHTHTRALYSPLATAPHLSTFPDTRSPTLPSHFAVPTSRYLLYHFNLHSYKMKLVPDQQSSPIHPSSSLDLRKKLFYELGIGEAQAHRQTEDAPTIGTDENRANHQQAGLARGIIDRESREPDVARKSQPPILTESLKFDFGEEEVVENLMIPTVLPEDIPMTPESNRHSLKRVVNSEPNVRRSARKLQFNEEVAVVPIPMRTEYSKRIRSRLWSNAEEIHENAARNSFEFASEGWNWRNVREDDDMFVCSISGELVHPVHYEDDEVLEDI